MNDESKFDIAIKNFKKVKNSDNPKFEKIDHWLEKESILYKAETKMKAKTYLKLKRGTIVKVDFGVNPGSELCHVHFAVVISKNDNIKQETVMVVPLTSKPGVGRLPLNNLIKDEIIKSIKSKYLKDEDVNDILNIVNEYRKYTDFSYAFISQIRPISKSRLIYSNNKFDIINKSKCSHEVLDKIDQAIMEEITGIKVYNANKLEKEIVV